MRIRLLHDPSLVNVRRRCNSSDKRVGLGAGAQVARQGFFTYRGQMVLLHGFIKKTQRTPDDELDLAMKRKAEVGRDKEAKNKHIGSSFESFLVE